MSRLSIAAIIPADIAEKVNSDLAAAGFGEGNFSVPGQIGDDITHYGLHAWGDTGLCEAVQGIQGVIFDLGTGDPLTRINDLFTGQGAIWSGLLPEYTRE